MICHSTTQQLVKLVSIESVSPITPTNVDANVARNLRHFREESGLSQGVLAIRVHVDRTEITHYESGVRTPTISVLAALATVLDQSLDAFIQD